jgi:hypothetical protein
LNVEIGEQSSAGCATEKSELRAEHQHRGKEPAGRPGRIRDRAEGEPKEKRDGDGGERRGASEHTLSDAVSAPNETGGKPGQHADRCAE